MHHSLAISQHTFAKFSGIVLLPLTDLDSVLACIVLSDLDNYTFELFLFVFYIVLSAPFLLLYSVMKLLTRKRWCDGSSLSYYMTSVILEIFLNCCSNI